MEYDKEYDRHHFHHIKNKRSYYCRYGHVGMDELAVLSLVMAMATPDHVVVQLQAIVL